MSGVEKKKLGYGFSGGMHVCVCVCMQHYPTLPPLIAITSGGLGYYHFDSLQKFLY